MLTAQANLKRRKRAQCWRNVRRPQVSLLCVQTGTGWRASLPNFKILQRGEWEALDARAVESLGALLF